MLPYYPHSFDTRFTDDPFLSFAEQKALARYVLREWSFVSNIYADAVLCVSLDRLNSLQPNGVVSKYGYEPSEKQHPWIPYPRITGLKGGKDVGQSPRLYTRHRLSSDNPCVDSPSKKKMAFQHYLRRIKKLKSSQRLCPSIELGPSYHADSTTAAMSTDEPVNQLLENFQSIDIDSTGSQDSMYWESN